MAVTGIGVELLVIYPSQDFSVVVAHPRVSHQIKLAGSDALQLRCSASDLQPGWVPFDQVRNSLQPLFVRGHIRKIAQSIGFVEGRAVTWVESPDEVGQWKYSDMDGRHLSAVVEDEEKTLIFARGDEDSERELERAVTDFVPHKGGRVLIAGGQRRTVLFLGTVGSQTNISKGLCHIS